MDSKELEQLIESYNKEVEETKKERSLTEYEIDNIDRSYKNIPAKYNSYHGQSTTNKSKNI